MELESAYRQIAELEGLGALRCEPKPLDEIHRDRSPSPPINRWGVLKIDEIHRDRSPSPPSGVRPIGALADLDTSSSPVALKRSPRGVSQTKSRNRRASHDHMSSTKQDGAGTGWLDRLRSKRTSGEVG